MIAARSCLQRSTGVSRAGMVSEESLLRDELVDELKNFEELALFLNPSPGMTPRLGVVGNSAIMNVEPVFALVLGWLILGQSIAPVQVAGALIVVGAVMALGMRRR